MAYTIEGNHEIKKVLSVFSSQIKNIPGIDVSWSDKMGYLLLEGISRDRDYMIIHPTTLRTGEDLCLPILRSIAWSLIQNPDPSVDARAVYEANELEKQIIREALAPYMQQLPEYEYLVEHLFQPSSI